jgi:plastocyanin
LRALDGVSSARRGGGDTLEVHLVRGNRVTLTALREVVRSAGLSLGAAEVSVAGQLFDRGGQLALLGGPQGPVYLLDVGDGRGPTEVEAGRGVVLSGVVPGPVDENPSEPRTLHVRKVRTAAPTPRVAPPRPTPLPPRPGAVGGVVTLLNQRGRKADASDIVIYLDTHAAAPPAPRQDPQLRQRNTAFVPGLLVVTVGTTVDFPNDDKIFHNVFSLSEPARFDLGLYKSGTSRSVTFRQPGVVDVYCNIHPEMVSKVKVLDTPYYAVTSPSGAFKMRDVPAGSYAIVAWQAYGPTYRGSVRVRAGEEATVRVELVAGEPDTRHVRKDLTPYGRYH